CLVGVRRFELPTPTSLTWCANRAALHPEPSFKADSPQMGCNINDYLRFTKARNLIGRFAKLLFVFCMEKGLNCDLRIKGLVGFRIRRIIATIMVWPSFEEVEVAYYADAGI